MSRNIVKYWPPERKEGEGRGEERRGEGRRGKNTRHVLFSHSICNGYIGESFCLFYLLLISQWLYWAFSRPYHARLSTDTYRNRKEHTDLPSFSQKLCSNYPIIYYLSQMLKQLKPTDVIVSQKWELLLQILHTDTHSMFFHNIPRMSSSIAA